MKPVQQMLEEITERQSRVTDFTSSAGDIPYLLTLVNYYRGELISISKPRLGGREQQYRAQNALKFNPQEKPE